LLGLPLLAGALLLAAGCSDSDNDPPPVGNLRVLHASPDAPAVNVLIDGEVELAGVDYKEGSPSLSLPAGTYEVAVEGLLPGGQTATVIGPASISIEDQVTTNVVAAGPVASIAPIIVEQTGDPSPGTARVRVLHAAPAAPEVAVYATAPNADLAAESPLGTFEFGGELGPVEVPAGDYQIRVTLPAAAPGAAPTVVYDAGTVGLGALDDLLIVAVENTGPGDAPISLVVLSPAGPAELLDVDTPARLRVVHASPDAPPVDVVVNDDFSAPLLEDVPFPAASGYTPPDGVPPGDYNVKVTPAGNPGVVAIDADVSLAAGEEYTVAATDVLGNITPLVLVDDNRRVATEAKVRIVHAAPSAGTVDVYVVAPGTDIANVEPAVPGFEFQASTGYVSLEPGSYEVLVTPAGAKSPVAIGPLPITVGAGGVFTAFARDPLPGETDFGVILLDDFVAP
jgi:hypothetical protein